MEEVTSSNRLWDSSVIVCYGRALHKTHLIKEFKFPAERNLRRESMRGEDGSLTNSNFKEKSEYDG
jgi:hypothetical protein